MLFYYLLISMLPCYSHYDSHFWVVRNDNLEEDCDDDNDDNDFIRQSINRLIKLNN